MENASQALIIAGGILLAILTISLFVYMFNNISAMGNAQAQKEEITHLANWNAEWEAYNKRYLYGTDVLTVMNKAEQINNEVDIKIRVDKSIINNPREFVSNYKTSTYTCEEVEYSNKTGRVCKMIFKFVE